MRRECVTKEREKESRKHCKQVEGRDQRGVKVPVWGEKKKGKKNTTGQKMAEPRQEGEGGELA